MRAVPAVLTLVDLDRHAEARMLLRLAEATRPDWWAALLLLLLLSAVAVLAAGHVWGWSLIGAAVALALSRHGPRWWPGRRG